MIGMGKVIGVDLSYGVFSVPAAYRTQLCPQESAR